MEETKKFELNTKKLDNFDKIMSIKLDEIEELKVTSSDNSSKLLNVISLCSNLKTLIIEGDRRINLDKILLNIFKPQKLENLILNNVKLPNTNALKKLKNLKMISLDDIRCCNVKEFFEESITKPEKIEIINIKNTDMTNNSIEMLKKFCNIKELSLNNVMNCKLDEFEFFNDNNQINKIEILNNTIPINQINNLLKCKCSKNIDVQIEGKNKTNLKIVNGENAQINIFAEDFEQFSKDVNLYKFDEIEFIINSAIDTTYYIKMLKKYKAKISITIKNFACLTVEHARKIKEILKLEKINIKSGKSENEYKIDEYIKIRLKIDEIINKVSKHVAESEKFLEIYKSLGKKIEISEAASVLQNCLICMNIKSNIITGTEIENNTEHEWNQVKIEGKWYNVDLGLDAKNIKKNKTEYCLLSDKDFFETHVPKSGKNHYCSENFNAKLINVYFKTGLFKENLFKSYTELMFEKFKRILNFNKKQEILLLPSGDPNFDKK